jgi:hypothetical protein
MSILVHYQISFNLRAQISVTIEIIIKAEHGGTHTCNPRYLGSRGRRTKS